MKKLLLVLGLCLGVAQAEVPKEEFTFKVSKTRRSYATGRSDVPVDSLSPKSTEFVKADGKFPGKLDLRQTGKLVPIKDQGGCGSCVYFATTASFEDEMALAGKPVGKLAPQFLMDRYQWSCSGSLFDIVGGGLVKEGGMPLESSYPYKARDQRPQTPGPLQGVIQSAPQIDNTPLSIIGALNTPHVVPATIAASNSFMQYDGGVYNACDSMSTNHQISIVGYDCETAVDAQGFCVFDSQGKLPPGVGHWIVRNSWNTGFGGSEKGFFRIKMTDRSGRLCNNIAEEAGVLKTGLVPVVPVDGGWSTWSEFTACVNGQQSHSRTCTNPAPANGGKDCVGPSAETQACVVPPTPSPSSLDWKTILLIVGALAGIAALIIVIVKK